MPGQQGKTVLITGANTGIGYQDALAFYEKGAHVVLAVRNIQKGQDAAAQMADSGGSGSLDIMQLDLASLVSVKAFADLFRRKYQQLDILINNAGVMVPPPSTTSEGFELQFGSNFIGHFALTGLLYPLLSHTPHARVVTLSSGAHKWVDTIDFENLRLEKEYDARKAYATSKLADLLFALELQRRIERAGDHVLSLAAHPGITQTDLQRHLPDAAEQMAKYPDVMQPWQGALPTLYAATAPDVAGGTYYGPHGPNELNGYPAPAFISDAAKNANLAGQLWDYAERETKIFFHL